MDSYSLNATVPSLVYSNSTAILNFLYCFMSSFCLPFKFLHQFMLFMSLFLSTIVVNGLTHELHK